MRPAHAQTQNKCKHHIILLCAESIFRKHSGRSVKWMQYLRGKLLLISVGHVGCWAVAGTRWWKLQITDMEETQMNYFESGMLCVVVRAARNLSARLWQNRCDCITSFQITLNESRLSQLCTGRSIESSPKMVAQVSQVKHVFTVTAIQNRQLLALVHRHFECHSRTAPHRCDIFWLRGDGAHSIH